MATMVSIQPAFACDAMLGGLARWLRAAGYDASWQVDVCDRDLIDLARREGRLLLSSDTGIFQIGIVRDGHIAALFIPHGLNIRQQLAFVLSELSLPVQEPRCMACGGEIVEMAKEQVQGRVPTRTFAWLDRFWQCIRCHQVYWRGTHWQRIAEGLKQITSAMARKGDGLIKSTKT